MTITNTPRVIWETLTDSSLFTGVVASSDVEGFEPENVYDYKMSTFWEATSPDENIDFEFSSPVTADCLFFIGSTIAEEGHDWSFQYWNGAIWVDLIADTTPTNDKGIFQFFNAQAATKFRFNIKQGGGGGAKTFISNILFGEFLLWERGLQPGFAFPEDSDAPDILNSTTQGGNFIGRTLLGPNAVVSCNVQNMTPGFVASDWNKFTRHMQQKPFGFLPDPANRPTQAAYAWTEGPPGPRPSTQIGFISHSFKLNIRTE